MSGVVNEVVRRQRSDEDAEEKTRNLFTWSSFAHDMSTHFANRVEMLIRVSSETFEKIGTIQK